MRWLCAAALVSLLLAAPAGAAPLAEIDAGDNSRFVLVGERILMWQEEGDLLSAREPDGTRRVLYRARGFKAQDSLIDQVAATDAQLAILTQGYDAVGEGGREWSSLRSEPLAVNGRWAATRDSARAAAYDLETRARVANVAADADPGLSPPPVGVSASGTLVYTDAADRLWAYVPATRQTTRLMDHVHAVVDVVGERAYVVARAQTSPFHHLDRLVAYDLVSSEARTLTVGLENTQFHTDHGLADAADHAPDRVPAVGPAWSAGRAVIVGTSAAGARNLV